MGDALGGLRLTVITLLGLTALVAWLIVAHDLVLCGAVRGTVLAAALLIDTSVLEQNLQRPVAFNDYLTLAWIISSLATVGGAIGSGWRTRRRCGPPPTATIPNPAAGGTRGIGRRHRGDPSAATAGG
jgi:hypothetical protein